jgi:hypothetical protein
MQLKSATVHDWQRLLDDARSDELAQSRARERWLRQQATEDATLVGTLFDLAEAAIAVSVALRGGRRHDGTIEGLGTDVVVLDERGDHVAVRLAAAVTIRPQPGRAAGPATGARAAALDLTFVELLARLAPDRPDVALALITGDLVTGALIATGSDVVTVRVAPGVDGVVYCPSTSIASARFRSG